MNIADVINYILSSFKFGVWTPWSWHTHAETCRGGERLYFYVCLYLVCSDLVL